MYFLLFLTQKVSYSIHCFEPCVCHLVYLGDHSTLVHAAFPHAFCVVAE